MKYLAESARKRQTISRVLLQILIDLLMVGIILLTFAFFHHVLPAIQAQQAHKPAQTTPSTQPTEPPVTTTAPPETTAATTVATEPPTEPVDNRTEWQIKFEDHFTDEIIQTENSYSSPNVSITIDTVTLGEGDKQKVYYVADIYVASIENFVTYTAHNEMTYFDTQDILEMDAESDAIVAISGDFLTYQSYGFLVRNGEVYRSDKPKSDICVLYPDGVMETYMRDEYEVDEILASGALQVWTFGPELLDNEGNVKDKYSVSTAVGYTNPRSAVGYYEPGHYCFVIVDGRQRGHSIGMEVDELAQVFYELGCTAAYNLDGGGSAVMSFNDELYSKQSNGGRKLGDILLIRDVAPIQQEEEEDEIS